MILSDYTQHRYNKKLQTNKNLLAQNERSSAMDPDHADEQPISCNHYSCEEFIETNFEKTKTFRFSILIFTPYNFSQRSTYSPPSPRI